MERNIISDNTALLKAESSQVAGFIPTTPSSKSACADDKGNLAGYSFQKKFKAFI